MAVPVTGVNQHNVGRIAERIVSTELEYRGFRVSDLNKEGISANADLIAVRDGVPWQIQVKGASNKVKEGWWWNYGRCSEAIIRREEPMFNKARNSFYRADIVVLVSARSPKDYQCLVLPVEIAERAAQINLDAYSRRAKRNGDPHKPGPIWVCLDWIATKDPSRKALYEAEQELLRPHRDNWSCLEDRAKSSAV
jgi:hypothetical protein